MFINLSYDASVAGAPAGFIADLNAAVSYLDSLFTNTVTINLAVGWGEVMGQALPGNALGSSIANYYAVDYATAVGALKAVNAPGSATLPATSPLSGTLAMSSAEAKALGLVGPSAAIDGYVGFSNTLPFGFAAGVAPAAGTYYLIGVIEHEITEDLGRVSLLNYQPVNYSLADLYRYSAPGVRDLTPGGAGSTAYFSVDNGVTSLGVWNNNPGNGDLLDWYPGLPVAGAADAMNDYTAPGVRTVLSPTDLTLMKALGWTTGSAVVGQSITAVIESPPSGVVSAGATVSITIDFNTVAIVAGAPTLTLNDGGVATYVSGSGTATLTFHYIVAPTDSAVASLAVTALNLNGGTVRNDSGLALSLSLSGVAQSGPQVTPSPVWVSGQTLTVYENHGAPASGLIAAIVSPAGDSITQYAFLDTGAAGGHLTLGGVTQASGVWVVVGAAALPTVQYVGGAGVGAESVQIKVYDATLAIWSPVTSATATTLAPVNVANTAAWVSANLDLLQSGFVVGSLGTITLTDATAPTLTITASQLGADAGALSKISGTYAITASGVMGAAAAAGVSASLRGKLTVGVAVSDSAANVAASLPGLQVLASVKKLAAVTLTDGGVPALTIPATLIYSDSAALILIASPFAITGVGTIAAFAASHIPSALTARLSGPLTVADTGANVATNLAGLQLLTAAGHIASIALTDLTPPTLSITAAQLSADTLTLGAISGSFTLAVSGSLGAVAASHIPAALSALLVSGLTITDSAANIVAYLTPLQALAAGGHLAAITLTNVGTPVLTITAAQISSDWGALSAIATPHTLNVTGVLAADAGAVAALANVGVVAISDSAAAVSSSIDALQSLAAAGRLGAVVLTDASPPTLSLPAIQIAADAAALSKISSPFLVSPSGTIGAAAAAAIPAAVRTKFAGGLQVSDTAADLAANLVGLQAVAAAGKLASIALTDAGAPVFALTATQLSADALTLSKIVTPYAVTASGTLGAAAAAALSTLVRPHLTAGLAVSDASAAVVVSLAGLQGLAAAGKLASITLTDFATPTLAITAAQLSGDLTALGLIVSPFGLTVTGPVGAAVVAKLPAALVSELAAGLAVADTAASVTADLANLQALAAAGKLAGVTLTNATTPVLTLTAAKLAVDAQALAAISSPYAVSASGASAAFNGDAVRNFAVAGSVLDVTDLNPATLMATFTENTAATAGVLTLQDGVHSLSVTLFGQLMAAGYTGTAASAGIVAASDGSAGVKLTYNAALAVVV